MSVMPSGGSPRSEPLEGSKIAVGRPLMTAELKRLRVRAGVDTESSNDPRVATRVAESLATGDVRSHVS